MLVAKIAMTAMMMAPNKNLHFFFLGKIDIFIPSFYVILYTSRYVKLGYKISDRKSMTSPTVSLAASATSLAVSAMLLAASDSVS